MMMKKRTPRLKTILKIAIDVTENVTHATNSHFPTKKESVNNNNNNRQESRKRNRTR
jgi:hypothetical protein